MIKKNIPNFFTLCNLFCGCIAIVFAFEGNLVWSAYMVGIACVFDFLDGMVARALNVHSEIGKQLDSLADMVSFGVVPGVMMYKMIVISFQFIVMQQVDTSAGSDNFGKLWINSELSQYLYFPFLGFCVTIFSAIRLAKFNLDTRQSDSFIGLPTPANAIFIGSLPLIIDFANINWTPYFHSDIAPPKEQLIRNSLFGFDAEFSQGIIINPYFLIALSVISSISLIAPIPLFALKFKNFSWADNQVRYIFLSLALALLIVFQFSGIPLIIILYIVLSVINNLLIKKPVQ